MSAQTWKTLAGKYGVILVVEHACGHEGRYSYASERFARGDVETQQTPVCRLCRKSAMQKRLEKLTHAPCEADSDATP